MEQKKIKLDLISAKVTDVTHVGMGKRVCIDTVDCLKQNEGMLVGSKSCGGVLVSSETHYLPYMDLRPFRVNAEQFIRIYGDRMICLHIYLI